MPPSATLCDRVISLCQTFPRHRRCRLPSQRVGTRPRGRSPMRMMRSSSSVGLLYSACCSTVAVRARRNRKSGAPVGKSAPEIQPAVTLRMLHARKEDPAQADLDPGERGLPRYSQREFSAYRYVPGVRPHPTRDPSGHSYRSTAQPRHHAPRDPEEWRTLDDGLYGVDLFNRFYFWEAHEAWEGCGQQSSPAARHPCCFRG
jgi:hypothetical protein